MLRSCPSLLGTHKPMEERALLSWTVEEVREERKGLLDKGHGPRAKVAEGLGILGLVRA